MALGMLAKVNVTSPEFHCALETKGQLTVLDPNFLISAQPAEQPCFPPSLTVLSEASWGQWSVYQKVLAGPCAQAPFSAEEELPAVPQWGQIWLPLAEPRPSAPWGLEITRRHM